MAVIYMRRSLTIKICARVFTHSYIRLEINQDGYITVPSLHREQQKIALNLDDRLYAVDDGAAYLPKCLQLARHVGTVSPDLLNVANVTSQFFLVV